MIGTFDMGAVREIETALDAAGLDRSPAELVVIGGAAMAAWGVKSLSETDIDVAVTDDLAADLSEDPYWERHDLHNPVYEGLLSAGGTISVIHPPMKDSTYKVPNDVLVQEGLIPNGAHYRYSPLLRLLDWKLTLVGTGPSHAAPKHLKDSRKIARHLLEL